MSEIGIDDHQEMNAAPRNLPMRVMKLNQRGGSVREGMHNVRTYIDGMSFIQRIQSLLNIAEYRIYPERVSRYQVTAEDNNQDFVGICIDHVEKAAILYYTRNLTEEDIVHELIHVAHPDFGEEQVNIATAKLLSGLT